MVLASLRARTRPLHDRIERTLDLPGRLRSPDDYVGLLVRFYGFYAPLEERLGRVVGLDGLGIDFAARRKAVLLEGDLLALGMPRRRLGAVPRCGRLPAPGDPAACLGCLYVLEGATLGGQIVRREVRRSLGLEAGAGCSFFGSYGDRVGEMWKEFCGAMTAYAARNPSAEGPLVAAAVETFDALDRWLAGEATCDPREG
jgi:heme oxygenase